MKKTPLKKSASALCLAALLCISALAGCADTAADCGTGVYSPAAEANTAAESTAESSAAETIATTDTAEATDTADTTAADTEAAPEEETDPNADFTFTISFIGDCVLAESPNYKTGFNDTVAEKGYDYFFEKVKYIFEADDYTFANLECVLTDMQVSRRTKTGVAFWFLGKADYVNILKSGGIDGVSVCNNHTYDYLGVNADGSLDANAAHNDMRRLLQENGLGIATYEEALYIEKNGFKVAIVADGMWNSGQAQTLANRVKAAKKEADYVIAFWHGGIEYYHNPALAYSNNVLVASDWKVQGARSLVDAGADLVIGGHPHVLQPMEQYKGATIIYSLGNFCYGGNNYPENATVIFQPVLTISAAGVLVEQTINLIPCYVCAPVEGAAKDLSNFRPEPMTDETAIAKVINFLWGTESCPAVKSIHK